MSEPAASCLVWGYRIRTVFLSEFGAVGGEAKDPRLKTARVWPLSSGFSVLLLGIPAPATSMRTLPFREGQLPGQGSWLSPMPQGLAPLAPGRKPLGAGGGGV